MNNAIIHVLCVIMDQYKSQLENTLQLFEDTKKKYMKELKQSPEGRLICSMNKERNQFYVATKLNGGYMRKGINKNPDKIKKLARKEFLRKTLKEIDTNITVVNRALKGFHAIAPEEIISSMTKAYRKLPTEYFFDKGRDEIVSDKNEISIVRVSSHKEWGHSPYKMSLYKPEEKNKLTSRGLPMRSKAEVMIAEKLYEYNVPFRYEQLMPIGHYELSPDFTFEDRCHDEFYLEYCGMMDDEDYIRHHVWKRNLYEQYGICQWKNIYYMYDRDNQINMITIDSLIRNEIIPRL